MGSPCGKLDPQFITKLYKRKHYNGIIVTEHFTNYIINDFYPSGNYEEKINLFLKSYKLFETETKKNKMKIFLGMEIGLTGMVNSDYLIYGITEKFLLDNKNMYRLNQQQLFEVCTNNNLFMVQAHPFRKGITLGNPLYMHGVEVFNGNKRHNNHNIKALRFAKKYNLKQSSGSDFHEKEDLATGGIIVPDGIETNNELISYFNNNQAKLIKKGRIDI
jgi:hypothetical protein